MRTIIIYTKPILHNRSLTSTPGIHELIIIEDNQTNF